MYIGSITRRELRGDKSSPVNGQGGQMSRSIKNEIEIQTKTIARCERNLALAKRRAASAIVEANKAQDAFAEASRAFDAALEARADTATVRAAQSAKDKARSAAKKSLELASLTHKRQKQCEASLKAAQTHMAHLQQEQQHMGVEDVLRSMGVSAGRAREAARATPVPRSERSAPAPRREKKPTPKVPTHLERQRAALAQAWGAK
jgi:hypothetical protein